MMSDLKAGAEDDDSNNMRSVADIDEEIM
jgi:hypothetical protein